MGKSSIQNTYFGPLFAVVLVGFFELAFSTSVGKLCVLRRRSLKLHGQGLNGGLDPCTFMFQYSQSFSNFWLNIQTYIQKN